MAAMSAVPTTTTAIHATDDARDTWDFSNGHVEPPEADTSAAWKNDASSKTPNGTSTNPYDFGFEPLPPSRKKPSTDNISGSIKGSRSWDRSNRSSDASTKPPFNDDGYAARRAGDKRDAPENIVEEWDDEASKWIHRDKLAKIESRELQAAGIVLPRPRATSRPRKGRSQERPNGVKRTTSVTREIPEAPTDNEDIVPPRHRKNSSVAEHSLSDDGPPSWDLRLPEEIEAEGDGNYWISADTINGGSKIPVAKLSPLPIPETYLDRSSPSSRRQSDVPADADALMYPKTRSRSGSVTALTPGGAIKPASRSATDLSPKKNAPRKTSAPAKTPSSARPKTRGGANKDSTSSTGTTRPSTRSGELSPSVKQPEGDPPWMIGSYKPDPRLPPDQQLLPTVAKRLQQEKWEKEGKFGSVYDREFRPLTDDALLAPPEVSNLGTAQDEERKQEDWPLKPDARSPTLKQGTSYSTIPKISEKPQMSPLPSPRTPVTMVPPQPQPPAQPTVPRVPEPEEQKKAGCGCCIIM